MCDDVGQADRAAADRPDQVVLAIELVSDRHCGL